MARPLTHIAGYFVLVAVMAFGGTFVAALVVPARAGPSVAWFAKCLIVMCLVVALTWAYLRRAGIGWRRYGVGRHSWRYGLGGLAAGLALAAAWSIPVFLVVPFHWATNETFSGTAFALATGASFGIGIAEEVGYRTYGMDRLLDVSGPLAALLIPTAVFVGVHVAGGVPWLAGLLVVGSSSVMYGCLMLATRSLPFVAAFHIANNLGQDALLRTSAGSLWKPVFHADVAAASQPAIWLGMMLLNLLVASGALAIWRRTPRPEP
ncbi:CPBP family intramembrane glutamic endopeptidase [Luteibacter jiangsuensis]